jgi:hypothetical protein
MRRSVLILLFILVALNISAQNSFDFRGIVRDNEGALLLQGVTIILIDRDDSSLVKTALSGANGEFYFSGIKRGSYYLKAESSSFQTYETYFMLKDSLSAQLNISLIRSEKNLQGITLVSKVPLMTQKGDTTEYQANRFKVNPDASAEDLVKKMPGISVDRAGTVTAQGEQVRSVTVDGRRFFGDDATAALRNLPAEIIEKIQVFDRLSDQAQFTGFDDGSGQRSMNIVTKPGNRNGQFGKVYSGYGTDDRYNGGGNISFFKGDRRISVIGLVNNINQQNFSTEDLLGVTGSGGGRSGGSGNRGGGRMGGGGMWGGNGNNNFLVGQQNGVSATKAAGINFSDKWGKKLDVSGSYFFNDSKVTNDQESSTEFFLSAKGNETYREEENASSANRNHRVNLRLEYKLDSFNSFIYTPSVSFQNNKGDNLIDGLRSPTEEPDSVFSKTLSNRKSDSKGYNSNHNLLYRHNFLKKGRTVSLNLSLGANVKDADIDLRSQNNFVLLSKQDSLLQQTVQDQSGLNYSANLNYTEPFGENGQLQISYSPSFNNNKADQLAYIPDPLTGKYSALDSFLSSKFDNMVETHQAGVNFRKGDRDNMFSVGLNFRYAGLTGDQDFPRVIAVSRNFGNLLPNFVWRKKFPSGKSVSLNYRTAANLPSISQLQAVIDNSNPLILTSGNPDLLQQVNHTLSTRFSTANATRGTSFFGNAFLQLSQDYIGSSITVFRRDSITGTDTIFKRGTQLTRPVNLSGFMSGRLFLTESFPVKFLKCNLSLTGGLNWSRLPGKVNEVSSQSETFTWTGGMVLASNISEFVDFNISYNGSFSNAVNNTSPELNNRYVNHSAGVQFNLLSRKGWFLQQDLSGQYYSGLSAGFNQQYWLWNIGVGKKFLPKQLGELRLQVFDALGQNQSITRTVTETYLEDVRNTVLTRYFMLTFTYKFRNFGAPPVQTGQGEGGPRFRMQGGPGMF